MGRCLLCEKERVLRNSHIIPESSYSPLYDDKHRMVTLFPSDPERTGFLQKGIRQPLLCEECEQLLNERYEKPFQAYWWRGRALDSIASDGVTILHGIDYRAFKLFHLSVLLRASACTHENFSYVQLPDRQRERIRRMVLEGSPGPAWKYPIIASAVDNGAGGIWEAVIGPAHYAYLDSHPCFVFTFAGMEWRYIVSTRRIPYAFQRCALNERGELPTARMDWGSMEVYRHLNRRAKERNEPGTSSEIHPPRT